jgi:hypothetical protein
MPPPGRDNPCDIVKLDTYKAPSIHQFLSIDLTALRELAEQRDPTHGLRSVRSIESVRVDKWSEGGARFGSPFNQA